MWLLLMYLFSGFNIFTPLLSERNMWRLQGMAYFLTALEKKPPRRSLRAMKRKFKEKKYKS